MKFLLENWRKYINEVSLGSDLAKSIEYTAFFLDPSHEGTIKLKEMVPEGWKEHADHMTMIPPTQMKQRLSHEQFAEGCLKVVAVAQDERVMAGLVETPDDFMLYSKNEIPHITIATAVDPDKTSEPDNPAYYSPGLSNEFTMEDFEEDIEPIEVCGEVKEKMRQAPSKEGGQSIALGQCYPFANKMAEEWMVAHIDHTKPAGQGVHPDMDNKSKFRVVHGRVTNKWNDESYNHAWVEKGDVIFDWQTHATKPDGIPRDVYYDMFQPEAYKEYTAKESIIMCVRAGHPGPWSEQR